jgi:hypothetical protein
VTVNVSLWQNVEPVTVGAFMFKETMVWSAPLSEPKVAGAELITRNRYKALVKSVEGKVLGMVPLTDEVSTPIVVGAPAKLPVLSEI